jgi:hypothetical protein
MYPWCGLAVCWCLSFFSLFFVKNGEEQEQSDGNQTWPEISLVKVDSFCSTINLIGL